MTCFVDDFHTEEFVLSVEEKEANRVHHLEKLRKESRKREKLVMKKNKKYEIEDEIRLRALYDKRVSDEVKEEFLGDKFNCWWTRQGRFRYEARCFDQRKSQTLVGQRSCWKFRKMERNRW